jgi:hypothetical protein
MKCTFAYTSGKPCAVSWSWLKGWISSHNHSWHYLASGNGLSTHIICAIEQYLAMASKHLNGSASAKQSMQQERSKIQPFKIMTIEKSSNLESMDSRSLRKNFITQFEYQMRYIAWNQLRHLSRCSLSTSRHIKPIIAKVS